MGDEERRCIAEWLQPAFTHFVDPPFLLAGSIASHSKITSIGCSDLLLTDRSLATYQQTNDFACLISAENECVTGLSLICFGSQSAPTNARSRSR